MYRLIAIDIDDTLLAPDGSLPEANRQALERLHARGVAVVLSSGRATASMVKVAADILPPADDEYLISFNGARVTTLLSGTILHERTLTTAAIGAVLHYTREQNLLVLGYRDDYFLSERDDERCGTYARNTGLDYRVVDDLEAELRQGSPKLLIIDEPS
ncbi:MAG: HAD-IIB family hydrolase, partial [Spirochaetaceae bacterium]